MCVGMVNDVWNVLAQRFDEYKMSTRLFAGMNFLLYKFANWIKCFIYFEYVEKILNLKLFTSVLSNPINHLVSIGPIWEILQVLMFNPGGFYYTISYMLTLKSVTYFGNRNQIKDYTEHTSLSFKSKPVSK